MIVGEILSDTKSDRAKNPGKQEKLEGQPEEKKYVKHRRSRIKSSKYIERTSKTVWLVKNNTWKNIFDNLTTGPNIT